MPLRANGGLACSSLGIPLWPLVALVSLVTSAACQQERHSRGRPRKFISYYGHREVMVDRDRITIGDAMTLWSPAAGRKMDISSGPTPPSWDGRQVQEGENVIIYCFADPKAEISWTKDGSPLRHWSAWHGYSVSDYNVQDFKISRLEVQAADADFSGGYSCSRESLAKHFVQVTAMQDSSGAQTDCHVLAPCPAPVGARVNLECRAYARPDPHVTWLFGDRSRVSSPLLSVDNVSISHSGTYRCSASHERCARLVAESDVTVNVFESTIRTNEGFPGSGITLTPGADALRLLCDYPADRSAKIVWLKENATVPSGGKYTYDKKDQSLVIRKPERGDVGNYSCVALGRIVNETAMIVVGLKVEIHTSQSKHFKQGHDGFLSCKVDGYPTPTIRWYRNGHLLNAFKSSKFKYGGKRADDYRHSRHSSARQARRGHVRVSRGQRPQSGPRLLSGRRERSVFPPCTLFRDMCRSCTFDRYCLPVREPCTERLDGRA
ncbi:hypothetical protein HPB51_017047 [Rhipicephalus microplus]|uniref:Ig-like domain-containing protein n=1 Tax=Rhipicephalus microplus TaxID=6941 RepID=A0A9J6F482_RHIMP|nr:hypothetical protein HPB51_017047 [Rhipicephalus microplus]